MNTPKSPTVLLIDTDMLSKMVSDILATVNADPAQKSTCLNKVAARIAGPNHNWGFLTGQNAPVVAQTLKNTFNVEKKPVLDDLHTYSAPLELSGSMQGNRTQIGGGNFYKKIEKIIDEHFNEAQAQMIKKFRHAPIPPLEEKTPSFPSLEGWKKAGELIQKTGFTNPGDPMTFDYANYLSFMDTNSRADATVVAYLRRQEEFLLDNWGTEAEKPMSLRILTELAEIYAKILKTEKDEKGRTEMFTAVKIWITAMFPEIIAHDILTSFPEAFNR